MTDLPGDVTTPPMHRPSSHQPGPSDVAAPVRLSSVICGDVLDVLRTFPDESIHCVVTSPPYWGLRNYGVSGQIGLEATLEEYVGNILKVFQEVRRVLRIDGTLWLNLGDSYAGSWGNYSPKSPSPLEGWSKKRLPRKSYDDRTWRPSNSLPQKGLKPKDLVGIPWRVALALQADGWWLRSDIIWSKPNPMPESVTDRPTKAHEYVFLLSKSERYYYDSDAIRESGTTTRPELLEFGPRPDVGYCGHSQPRKRLKVPDGWDTKPGATHVGRGFPWEGSSRNARTVWTIATQPFPEAHFATFPFELARRCILAGCPEGGIVLDPFGGSGTVGVVAKKLQRKYVLVDLKAEYCAMAEERIERECGGLL